MITVFYTKLLLELFILKLNKIKFNLFLIVFFLAFSILHVSKLSDSHLECCLCLSVSLPANGHVVPALTASYVNRGALIDVTLHLL